MAFFDDSFPDGRDVRDDNSVIPTGETVFEGPARAQAMLFEGGRVFVGMLLYFVDDGALAIVGSVGAAKVLRFEDDDVVVVILTSVKVRSAGEGVCADH